MSLDFSLILRGADTDSISAVVYYRENGSKCKYSIDEWIEKHRDDPFGIPAVYVCFESGDDYVFDRNITHNLRSMAREAGLSCLWEPPPEATPEDLIPAIEAGINTLKRRSEEMKQLNPKNGWGKYEDLLRFAEDVLRACKQYPSAEIFVSR